MGPLTATDPHPLLRSIETDSLPWLSFTVEIFSPLTVRAWTRELIGYLWNIVPIGELSALQLELVQDQGRQGLLFRLGLRLGLLRLLLFRRNQGQQVDRPVFLPFNVQFGGIDRDLREVEFGLQRLQADHHHVEALQPGDGILFLVL